MSHHKRYLAPEDVADVYAEQTLEAVNGMRSARQLADAVDVPGEPDIGVRLAQRILDRRDELGGFTSLAQIFAVPLIGPERFTELVVCLSDAPWPDRPLSPVDQLRRELALLRRRVDALGAFDAGRRITMRAVQPQPFLGQTVTLIVTVIDGGDRPAIDVPVTLLATRGHLSASDGYTTTHGHLVTARTGIEGRLRVTLSLPTSEPLSPLQQSALATAIDGLGTAPATPQDAIAGLHELARQYAWEISVPLRQAVDSYARDFAPALLDTFTPREPLAAWRTIECGVLAFAPLGLDDDAASAVAATATLNLPFRDWIHPFVAAAIEISRQENRLRERLREATAQEQDAGRFVGAVYARAGEYIASRRGMIGAYVGQKAAETAIRDFITHELPENLPLEARAAVVPALDLASRTIASTDASVLQGLVSARTELKADLDKRGSLDAGSLAGLADRLGSVEGVVTGLPNRLGAVESAVAAVQSAVSVLPGADALDALRRDLTDRIAEVRTSLETRVDATRQELTGALARKADIAAIDQQLTRIDRSIDELRFQPPR